MSAAAARAAGPPGTLDRGAATPPWLGLLAGAAGMMVVAGVLFIRPLLASGSEAELAESLSAVEHAFAGFILAETLFVPLESWLGERARPWLLAAIGGSLVAVGVLAGGRAGSAGAQVAWSALGGAGAGLAYGASVAKAVKRFTDRKALALGTTSAVCAAVIALALAGAWALSGTRALAVLVVAGAAQALVVLIATLVILYPPPAPPPDW